MTELRRLPLDSILVPENRLRELDEDQAKAMAASIKENGQFHPIAAYRSSAATRPYTLIFGLHRYRAHQILELDEIDVIIRSVSEAPMLEIAENLFRHDLTELDRAAFTAEWCKLKGVKMGRPKKSDNVSDFFQQMGLSDRASRELGFSGRTGRRLRRIADHLHPRLKDAVRGTVAANNQTLLLKFSKMPHDDQAALANVIREGDLKSALKTLKAVKAHKKPDPEAGYQIFAGLWRTLSREQRYRFLSQNVQPDDYLEPETPVTVAEPKAAKTATPAKEPRKPVKPVRKSNAGRKPDDPKVKREKTFRKLFITELAEQLLPTKLAIDAPHVAYLRKQPPENQYVAACWIGNGHGHDLDDLKTKIDREKDDAAEWYATRYAETAGHTPPV